MYNDVRTHTHTKTDIQDFSRLIIAVPCKLYYLNISIVFPGFPIERILPRMLLRWIPPSHVSISWSTIIVRGLHTCVGSLLRMSTASFSIFASTLCCSLMVKSWCGYFRRQWRLRQNARQKIGKQLLFGEKKECSFVGVWNLMAFVETRCDVKVCSTILPWWMGLMGQFDFYWPRTSIDRFESSLSWCA